MSTRYDDSLLDHLAKYMASSLHHHSGLAWIQAMILSFTYPDNAVTVAVMMVVAVAVAVVVTMVAVMTAAMEAAAVRTLTAMATAMAAATTT